MIDVPDKLTLVFKNRNFGLVRSVIFLSYREYALKSSAHPEDVTFEAC